eukprot:2674408-Prymnesium_polylepis.1
MSVPESAKFVKKVLPIAGWVILGLQVAMVAVVLGGFSMPGALGFASDEKDSFTRVHYMGMFIVIPPVIASVFATYSMFVSLICTRTLVTRAEFADYDRDRPMVVIVREPVARTTHARGRRS